MFMRLRNGQSNEKILLKVNKYLCANYILDNLVAFVPVTLANLNSSNSLNKKVDDQNKNTGFCYYK